jgi:hypothetical protein
MVSIIKTNMVTNNKGEFFKEINYARFEYPAGNSIQ